MKNNKIILRREANYLSSIHINKKKGDNMAQAIIDTLKSKDTSGEEHIVYPRSKINAIMDDDGKTLDVILSEKDTVIEDFEERISILESNASTLSSILNTDTF